MSIFFSLGSIGLGILSWIIPWIAVYQYRKGGQFVHFSIYSFASCAMALVLQLFEIRYRANIEDFATIIDTIGAISVASVVLFVITFILNITVSNLYHSKNK